MVRWFPVLCLVCTGAAEPAAPGVSRGAPSTAADLDRDLGSRALDASPKGGDTLEAGPTAGTARDRPAAYADLPDALLDKLSPDEIVEVLQAVEARQAKQLSPEVVQKLSGEQLTDVLTAPQSGPERDWQNVLVPLFFFVCVAFVVGLPLWLRARGAEQRQVTLRLMVEKGVSIPAELLTPPAAKRSDLRRGVLLIAGGVGLGVFLGLVSQEQPAVASLGLIPLLIGAGHLLVWRLERREPASPTA